MLPLNYFVVLPPPFLNWTVQRYIYFFNHQIIFQKKLFFFRWTPNIVVLVRNCVFHKMN